jgi:hypothetical protein
MGRRSLSHVHGGGHDDDVTAEPEGRRDRWRTPTGEPCPRNVRVDGTIEGTGDCLGCGFCLLIAGLVDAPTEQVL